MIYYIPTHSDVCQKSVFGQRNIVRLVLQAVRLSPPSYACMSVAVNLAHASAPILTRLAMINFNRSRVPTLLNSSELKSEGWCCLANMRHGWPAFFPARHNQTRQCLQCSDNRHAASQSTVTL